jgi:hypothetical protein
MIATLRETKAALKADIAALLPEIPGGHYRTLNDPAGDCATLLTVIFDSTDRANAVATRLGTRTVGASGWHVYGLMDQIVEHKTPNDDWSEPARCAQPGDLPQTDDILGRAVNISVGVVDSGIGASFGVNITSTRDEIAAVARTFADACRET